MSEAPASGAVASEVNGRARFKLIDALRGVAATWVVAYHLYNAISPNDELIVPAPVRGMFHLGEAGVQVFFVLSGFVIASNLEELARITPATIGRFMLRRSLRLDPVYWAVIALNVVFLVMLSTSEKAGHLGPGVVISNMLYLNGILGWFFLVPVGWTLTFEVQFYLGLAIALAIERVLARCLGDLARLIVFLPILAASVLMAFEVAPVRNSPWALAAWHMFFIGVGCSWLAARRKWGTPVVLVALAASISVFFVTHELVTLVAIVTGASILFAIRMGRLGFSLGGAGLQWLGKISYSLYLVHPLIGNKLLRFAAPRLPENPFWLNQGLRWACMLAAAGACFAVAWLFWRLIEKPTQAFSRRITVDR